MFVYKIHIIFQKRSLFFTIILKNVKNESFKKLNHHSIYLDEFVTFTVDTVCRRYIKYICTLK